jgi:hypothetical protein
MPLHNLCFRHCGLYSREQPPSPSAHADGHVLAPSKLPALECVLAAVTTLVHPQVGDDKVHVIAGVAAPQVARYVLVVLSTYALGCTCGSTLTLQGW